jgi:uncharacterized protein YoxC
MGSYRTFTQFCTVYVLIGRYLPTMTIQMVDLLYFCLAVGFTILVVFIVMLIQQVRRTLDKVDHILENSRKITDDIISMETKVKSGLLTTASTLLGLFAGKKRDS